MNSPFDQQPPDAPVVNLMQGGQESDSSPNFSNDSVVPGVASGNAKKKKMLLLVLLLVVVLFAAAAFFLMSSDSSAPTVPDEPMAAPVAPLAPPGDIPPANGANPLAPIAPPVGPPDAALPTGPLQDAAPAVVVHPCEQRMIDHANQNGADAKAYVEQNQAYLAECKKAMEAGAQ